MTPFIFPITVTVALFGSWVFLGALEACLGQTPDPKFNCVGSILFTATFASIGALLTGLMALVARVLLHPWLPVDTGTWELSSALLASLILVMVSYSVIRWNIHIGNIGIQLFGWLGTGLVVSGTSLLVMKHWMMREPR